MSHRSFRWREDLLKTQALVAVATTAGGPASAGPLASANPLFAGTAIAKHSLAARFERIPAMWPVGRTASVPRSTASLQPAF